MSMKNMIFYIIAFLAISGCASVESPNNSISPAFEGTWIGDSENINGQNLAELSPDYILKIKIKINGYSANVYTSINDKWNPLWSKDKVIPFNFIPYDTNAVIFKTYSARDSNCLWVETWSFSLTKESSDSIKAYFYRTVNNRDCKVQDDGIWTQARSVILKRVNNA